MVNFRLTRAQRAATHHHNHHHSATSTPTHTSNNRGNTVTSTRPDDEAPYYQIEASINQFAGTATAAASPPSDSEGGGGDRNGSTNLGSVEENTDAATGGGNSNTDDSSDLQNHDTAGATAGGVGGGNSDGSPSRAKSSPSAGSSSATRRVLRLLDSPRRKILGRMSGNAGSGAGLTSAGNDTGIDRAASPSAPPPPPASSSSSSPSTPRGVGVGGRSRQLLRQVMPHPSGTRKKDSRADDDDDEGNLKMPAIAAAAATTFSSASSYPVQETNYLTTPLLVNLKKASATGPPPPTSVQTKYTDPSNILEWLHDEAPGDILPRVLSFAGSRRIATLSRTSKSWRRLCLSETVWQTACEDTGKYRPGVDPPLRPSTTWLQHYCDNPLVPVDYDTIQGAFYKSDACAAVAPNGDATNRHPTVPQHERTLRVLLKPTTYVLREALVVHALGRAEVTIETVDGPSERMVLRKRTLESRSGGINGFGRDIAAEGAAGAAGVRLDRSASATSSGSAKRRLRDLLSCRSTSGVGDLDGIAAGLGFDPSSSTSDDLSQSSSSASYYFQHATTGRPRTESLPILPQDPDLYHDGCYPKYAKRRAVLVLKSKKGNEPLVRVRQGTLRLKDVDVVHNANGTDIWNGNAAVQVQPPFDEAGEFPVETAPPHLPATAYVDSCDITSLSGRGVVTIDGGRATVTNSHVHHCAATGIYIGGPSSEATVRGTDVVQNGYGNKRNPRRGIGRGHSGVYLEQGTANLRDCNVSNNALTGISAVSADNALLDVRGTDLMSNETMQLEMPPPGSRSYRRSISRDNRIHQEGSARARSGLVPPEHEAVASPSTVYNGVVGSSTDRQRNRNTSHGRLPQSPASDADEEIGSPN